LVPAVGGRRDKFVLLQQFLKNEIDSMRRISQYLFFLVFFLVSVIALAQEQAVNKADLNDPRFGLDQAPTNVGDVAKPAAPAAQPRITNAPTLKPDGGALGRPNPGAAKDMMGPPGLTTGALTPKAPLSEFQKFLLESSGRRLPIFGAEFFVNAPSTFAPIFNSPVPPDYPMGPGDEVLIRGWGSIDIDLKATIDRNGLVTIPTVGAVVLGGVKAGDVESVVRGAVGRLYKGVTLNVSFGQLRAISVYVVGQANRPGTYTVSNMSSLVTALFASGGPNANGSMRRVQVKRGSKIVVELDLYSFIAKGDKSADIKLQDGDTIYIPPAFGYVALLGMVNTPAIYELRGTSDTVASIVELAGGLPVTADPRRAFLERIDPKQNQPRTVEQFAMDAAGGARQLKNGDVINIASITPDFSNAVVLRGNVDQPVRAPFVAGMRLSDLIPSRAFLLTRASVNRRNAAVKVRDEEKELVDGPDVSIAAKIGTLIDPINWDYAVIERVNHDDLSTILLPFNLGNIFTAPSGPDNLLLEPGDTVTVFSQSDVVVPIAKRRVFVRVEGEVNVPGVYQMTPGDTLINLLSKAGGATVNAYLFGTEFYREQARVEQELNLKKAAKRLETQLRSQQATSLANARAPTAADAQLAEVRNAVAIEEARVAIERFKTLKPTGRIGLGLDLNQRSFAQLPALKLENGDRLVVPARPDFVHVFGAVNSETSPLWRSGYTVGRYLGVAGLTPEADKDNVFVMRVDGSIVTGNTGNWLSSSIEGVVVMPGDSIVVPEKLNRESAWSRFTVGVKEWAQIFANFGLGAAAVKTLRN
jgi:protein involved in polysaccharide export with SLBB domain